MARQRAAQQSAAGARTRGARQNGHFDNLLGNRAVQGPEHIHHVVHHLRHRNIENLQQRCKVGQMLRGVPLSATNLRAEVLANPQLPWLASVSVVRGAAPPPPSSVSQYGSRSGGASQPGPLRPRAARVWPTSGVVALCYGGHFL